MDLSTPLKQLNLYKRKHGRELASFRRRYRKELVKCKDAEDVATLVVKAQEERKLNPAVDAALSPFDSQIEDLSLTMKDEGIDYLKVKSAVGNLYISPKTEILPAKAINEPTMNLIERNKCVATLDRKTSQKCLNRKSLVKMGKKVKGGLYDRVCEVCGREYVAERATSKTCSPGCRQKLYRLSKKKV